MLQELGRQVLRESYRLEHHFEILEKQGCFRQVQNCGIPELVQGTVGGWLGCCLIQPGFRIRAMVDSSQLN